MGRNKYSQKEIESIAKLLRLKCSGTRFQQKQVRHKLRVEYEFNISDFGIQGQAFGESDLSECVKKGRIQILDDATIEAMKAKRLRDKLHDEAVREAEQITSGEAVDWRKAMEEWERENRESVSSKSNNKD